MYVYIYIYVHIYIYVWTPTLGKSWMIWSQHPGDKVIPAWGVRIASRVWNPP